MHWEPILQVGARPCTRGMGCFSWWIPSFICAEVMNDHRNFDPGGRVEILQGEHFMGKSTTCQVIQAVTFSSPIVGGHQQHLKGSGPLTIPKRSQRLARYKYFVCSEHTRCFGEDLLICTLLVGGVLAIQI